MTFRPLPSAASSRQAFTLVEVLAAVAILSIMVVALAQILAVVSTTWQQGLGRVNTFTKGRSILDMVAADVSRAVIRPDVFNFPHIAATPGSGSGLAFFTKIAGPGSTGTNRGLSLVTYQLNLSGNIPSTSNLQAGDLLRLVEPVPWSPTPTSPGVPLYFQQPVTAATPSTSKRSDVLGGGILDFEVLFVRTDGTAQLASQYKTPTLASPVTATSNPVVMMVIGVAAVDDLTLLKLGATGQNNVYSTLSGAAAATFTTATANNNSLKRVWDDQFHTILSGPVPKNMAMGMKTFERTVPCTPFN